MSTDTDMTPCSNCGGDLAFEPGTFALLCPYCGTENTIQVDTDTDIEEQNFQKVLARLKKDKAAQNIEETLVVQCETCGSQVSFGDNTTAGECAFCGSAINGQTHSQKAIKPQALLPFRVNRKEALEHFRHWLKKRWFAPSQLKHYARVDGLKGVYSPFWTYDADTKTEYRGRRGVYYYTTERYTTMEDGKQVTKTRQVRHTRWYSASGCVQDSFDDVLVYGAESLSADHVRDLEPWDLDQLVPYNPSFVAGFQQASYSRDLEECFGEAKIRMDQDVNQSIRHHIGGDEQRIDWKDTEYRSVTFKHILLPIWIASYRFKDKVYQFIVNARSGEVKGRRPWSVGKIILAIIIAIIVAVGVYVLIQYFGDGGAVVESLPTKPPKAPGK